MLPVSLQAPDKKIHSMWTTEIRRLLQVQFMMMKDMVIKSGTLDRRTYKGKTRRSKQDVTTGSEEKKKIT